MDIVSLLISCGVHEADAAVGAQLAMDLNFDDLDRTIDFAFIYSKRESARREAREASDDLTFV